MPLPGIKINLNIRYTLGVGSTCSNLVPLAGVRLMGPFRYTYVYLGVKVVKLNSALKIAKNRVILVFIIAIIYQ